MVVLGETPTIWGIIGILTTCMGGYILNFDPHNRRVMAPFKALANEPGSWIMLVVAFLFSIAAVIGKKGILHSSPLFFSVSFFVVLNLLLTGGLVVTGKVRVAVLKKEPLKGGLVGLLMFAHAVLHCYAIVLAKAVYMIAIKRTSILWGVGYGYLLFGEKRIALRFGGALCMLAGTVIIVLKG
jgi:drug/metabolite transporter (DMT)-like permease